MCMRDTDVDCHMVHVGMRGGRVDGRVVSLETGRVTHCSCLHTVLCEAFAVRKSPQRLHHYNVKLMH